MMKKIRPSKKCAECKYLHFVYRPNFRFASFYCHAPVKVRDDFTDRMINGFGSENGECPCFESKLEGNGSENERG